MQFLLNSLLRLIFTPFDTLPKIVSPYQSVSMNRDIFVGITACTLLLSYCEPSACAQNSSPAPAPSFFQMAGQKLMEGAQKKVIQNMSQTIQQQQNVQQNGSLPPYSSDPTSLLYAQTGTSNAAKQAAPCRSWVNPNEKPIAALLCIHGLGLQSNSYEFFGKEQSKRGLAVYAIDVRGFGAWMSARGKTQVNFNDCLTDIKQACESIRAAHPGTPLYILGESMGGAIALRAASMYPDLIDGLISSVPAGERFNQGKTSAKVFMNLLTGFNLANIGGDVLNSATQNQKLRDKWQQDPLARLNLSPQELIQFQDFMNSNHDAAKRVTDMPVLFVQGNGDQLVKPEGTWELFNDVAAKDKSFFAVPGEHLIFEEAQTQDAGPRTQNFQVISSWLTTKVGRRPSRRGMASEMPSGMSSGMPSGMPGGMSRYSGGGMSRYPGSDGAGRAMGWGIDRMPIDMHGLEAQVQLLDNNQAGEAIAQLEQLRAQDPRNASVAALLGRAYMAVNQPDKAGMMFRRAMRLNRGSQDQARAFNSYLLGMNDSQPGSTSGSWWSRGVSAAMPATSRGRVYAFYANWADQCKGMNDTLSQLSQTYGNRVDIQRVDIENPMSESLVEQFKIGPIPTVVFVAPNGQVKSTIIGESTATNYEAALRAISR
jgi:alpha-beta hydrolase superfamily lysophospholipase/thiol-disulfide isomerase/thioredoxin